MLDAIEMLKESNEFSKGGIFAKCELAQTFISNSKPDSFDYAITFSATIELIHPGFDLFKELYRVLNKGFVFIINENGHTYPRFYRHQLRSKGFRIIKSKKFGRDLTLLDCVKI